MVVVFTSPDSLLTTNEKLEQLVFEMALCGFPKVWCSSDESVSVSGNFANGSEFGEPDT